MLQYIEGRSTEDIDLIVSLPSLKQLPEIKLLSKEVFLERRKFESVQINFLLTVNPLFEKVRTVFVIRKKFVEREIKCATVEGLMLLKLYALPSLYRQGNFARVGLYENDVATLINDYNPDLKPIFTELTAVLDESEMESVREITGEITSRIARFRKGLSE